MAEQTDDYQSIDRRLFWDICRRKSIEKSTNNLIGSDEDAQKPN